MISFPSVQLQGREFAALPKVEPANGAIGQADCEFGCSRTHRPARGQHVGQPGELLAGPRVPHLDVAVDATSDQPIARGVEGQIADP